MVVAAGGDWKPTLPVPPTDEFVRPEKRRGSRILERGRVAARDCGGTLYDEAIATGQAVVAT